MKMFWFCLTTHWIDTDWILQNKIIAFRRFSYPHSHQNIFVAIKDAVSEYMPCEKKNSIKFDNATNNSRAVE